MTSASSAHLDPKQENPGPIASDSLAAESSRAGGAFSENRNSEPQKVKGSSSTFANTDTSSATTLAPAPSAAERDGRGANEISGSGVEKGAGEISGSGGEKGAEGVEERGGDQEADKADGYSDGTDKSSDTDKSSNKGYNQTSTDDSYARVAQSADAPQSGKPKETNTTSEDGFSNDPRHNASFTADIGSDNDPSRLAEATFQNRAAQVPGSKGPTQTEITADGQYDVLESEQGL